MSKLSLGCIITLFVLIVILALGLARATDRVNMLQQRVSYEVDRIADDFLQEDDFYPCLDKVYIHLEDIWERMEHLEEG